MNFFLINLIWEAYWGFRTRMVYLDCITCLRFTILVQNPWYGLMWLIMFIWTTIVWLAVRTACLAKTLLPFYTISSDLDLGLGHKVSRKQDMLMLFSDTHFNWSRGNLIWSWNNSDWTSWYWFWVRIVLSRAVTVFILSEIRNTCFGVLVHDPWWKCKICKI